VMMICGVIKLKTQLIYCCLMCAYTYKYRYAYLYVCVDTFIIYILKSDIYT